MRPSGVGSDGQVPSLCLSVLSGCHSDTWVRFPVAFGGPRFNLSIGLEFARQEGGFLVLWPCLCCHLVAAPRLCLWMLISLG